MNRQIRVLVADDHPATRDDVCSSVENDPRFTICAEVADAAAAVEAAIREQPDICLLDIRMPGNGISATREITSRLPGTGVTPIGLLGAEAGRLIPAGALGRPGPWPFTARTRTRYQCSCPSVKPVSLSTEIAACSEPVPVVVRSRQVLPPSVVYWYLVIALLP